MKSLRWRWISVISFIMIFTLLAGCSGAPLSDKFNEEEVKAAAENVVNLVNNGDAQSLGAISMPEMKEALNQETLGQIHEVLDKGGEFEKIESISVTGKKDKETEDEYAVSIVKAKYGEKNFIYTISFNEAMELAGLYVK